MLNNYKDLKAMRNLFLDRINMIDKMLLAFHPLLSSLINHPVDSVNPVR